MQVTNDGKLARQPGTLELILPPDISDIDSSGQYQLDSTLDEVLDSGSECSMDFDYEKDMGQAGYTQDPHQEKPSRILADVMHEMNKITRTISAKHTLHNKFAKAFSDSLVGLQLP